MFIVATNKGVTHTSGLAVPGRKELVPLTKEQADSICSEANRKAESLGISTRYQVVEKD